VDPQVMRHWGTGASLVPCALSYWFDLRMFGIAPGRADPNLLDRVVCGLLFPCSFVLGRPACSAVAADSALSRATIAVRLPGPRHYIGVSPAWPPAGSCTASAARLPARRMCATARCSWPSPSRRFFPRRST
jgi:hypothetical protein